MRTFSQIDVAGAPQKLIAGHCLIAKPTVTYITYRKERGT